MPDYIEFDPDGDVVLILPKGCDELDERKFKRMPKLLAEVKESPRDGDSDSEPVFKSLFKSSFLEGQSLSSAGTAEVSLPDDDPYSLEILLNIIHGRLKKVPSDLSTAELTQVAVLIDKYELHEISLIYSCIWIDSLKESLPTRFTQDLLPWMCIFRILSKPEYFAQTTKIALRESEGPLYNNAETTLPIPESLLETIESTRVETLSECCDMIQSLLDTYHGPSRVCKRQDHCDSMVLGSLLRALKSHDLLPLPASPFIGLSFQSLARKLNESSLPTLCERARPPKSPFSYIDYNQCGIKHGISEKVIELEAKLTGLSLDGELLPKT